MKFAGLCCAASQTTRANNPCRLPNLQLFQFTTSRRGCLIHRTSCIIFQSSPTPLVQLCSSSVPPPHRASCALFRGDARPRLPPQAPEGSSPATLQQPSSRGPQCTLFPALCQGCGRTSRDTSSGDRSALLAQAQGFLELGSVLVSSSSSSSRPGCNYVKGN